MTKTITLSGEEVAVALDGAHAHIRNDGADIIYAAKTAGITAGADGVASIPAGQADTVRGISGVVYLLGTGSVHIQSDDYVASPFKTSAQAGGSGADEVARAAISAHEGNTVVHVTAADRAVWGGVINIGAWSEAKPVTDYLDALTTSGFCTITKAVTGMPADGNTWLGIVNCSTVHKQITVYRFTAALPCAYSKVYNASTKEWGDWISLADGGNAASVGTYTEAAIAALEARIAALGG